MATISEALAIAVGHQRAGRPQMAEQIYRRILDADPDHVQTLYNLGNALCDQENPEEAIPCYRRTLELDPDFVEAYCNLGNALKDQGKLDEAIAWYRKAVERKPDFAGAHLNLGATFQNQGKLAEAVACYRHAIRLSPDFADAHWNLSLALLLQGDFARGWPEYEWRWRTRQMSPRNFRAPLWDGRSLEGRTILLHADQGRGDTLQFIRYAPLVKRAGATVIVECQKALLPLLARCAGIDRLVGRGDALPAFATQAPLLSLPGILRTSLDTIPADVPYLFALPALIESWRERLRALPGYKIGINWHGRPGPWRTRNIPLRQFAALAAIPGVRLISLQKGAGCEELADVREQFPVVELGDEVDQAGGAFMDTAAIMSNLDLVITSDTAVPHLAGGLGVPVWLALPLAPDWRWLLDRSDSPWYPTMRLFRQKKPGDWQGVFAEIETALRERMAPSTARGRRGNTS